MPALGEEGAGEEVLILFTAPGIPMVQFVELFVNWTKTNVVILHVIAANRIDSDIISLKKTRQIKIAS